MHDHVALARRVAARLRVVELDRVRRIGDVQDAEAAPVALEREVALEGDVGVDVGQARPRAERRDALANSRSVFMFEVLSKTSARISDGVGRRVGAGRGDARGPRVASSTGAQSESLFIVGSEPAHAAPLLFADRNVAVDSDQASVHGCACGRGGQQRRYS